MRTLIARYRARRGQGDLVASTLARMAEAVGRHEPGCLVYRASRSLEDPDVFVLYEEYIDAQALEAHRQTPHFLEFVEGTIVPVLESREREVLVPVLAAPGSPSQGGAQ